MGWVDIEGCFSSAPKPWASGVNSTAILVFPVKSPVSLTVRLAK